MPTPPNGKPSSTNSHGQIADVVAAASRTGADTEVVAEVLRSRFGLGRIPISFALGIDAETVIACGHHRPPGLVAAADQLWAATTLTPRPTITPTPPDGWTANAACVGKDPSMWYCEGEACDDEIEAVSVCVSCPAIGSCALSALREPHGIWGGLTPKARGNLLRFLRFGVVAPTPETVAPLAAALAKSSLQARIASAPLPDTGDGRLFEVPAAPVDAPRRRPRSRHPVDMAPLFA